MTPKQIVDLFESEPELMDLDVPVLLVKKGATNKAKYGSDFYRRIGAIGGKNGTTSGFYANRELAREAGKKGGRISKRGAWL